MRRTFLLALVFLSALNAQQYTRGVGVYPGNPKEDFAPTLVPDTTTYRNIALHRPAYQSSAYDYNLTGQLVTDGIKDTKLPRWFAITTSDKGLLKKQEREHPLDHNTTTTVDIEGTNPWIQIEMAGGDAPLEIDRLDVTLGRMMGFGRGATPPPPPTWTYVVSSSDDAKAWKELGRSTTPSVKFSAASRNRFLRLTLEAPTSGRAMIGELALFRQNERVEVGGPYRFSSDWKPAGNGQEWVYVDLGASCTFDRVVLDWVRRAASGSIQSSADAKTWTDVKALPASGGPVDDLKLTAPAKGRYVRVLMNSPASPEGYILSEVEVFGRGGLVPRPKSAPLLNANGQLNIAGGGWRIERDSQVSADGAALSRAGFVDKDWLVATVPATVLSSYWNAGAVPDPNYGNNQLGISDSFFYADFWYRNEFVAPALPAGRHAWLNLRGVNWKADVYLNGELLGQVDGGFMRGLFDVTKHLKPGARNAIAVRIKKNATPGSVKEKTWENPDKNGGAVGADNPTYHATAGWDWIPSVRGRDIGIWSDIYLSTSGPVTIENPFVSTKLPLPDTTRADLTVEATLHNSTSAPVAGTLRGRIGEVRFETPVTVEPGDKAIKLDPSTIAALRIQNPKLWWPVGYGDPNLYKVDLSFETAAKVVSDVKTFQTGIRQFTYSGDGNDALKIFINGRRFIGRGGNWGFPEVLLRYRAREYDTAVRLHKDMNFTMIRNWVGQTGDDEFFDACDKYGVVVWQDFWLANPVDGPNPDDNDLFLKNSKDFILKIRNHPSIGLYCGRNEGNPPKPIDDGLKSQIADLHTGMRYISSSAFGPVSGGGPYRTVAPKQYFQTRATTKLHSELGMPNIVNMESLQQMMPEEAIWPQGDVWGEHDFTLTGAQGGTAWRDMIEKNYGGATNAADWVSLSQFINYDGYRAMFEAQSKNRMGLLLWMSHPCWPSFVWQTYDYYFDPTAGYFGSKKGSEPLHIQWNPLTDTVEVVNYSGGAAKGLTAQVEILNMDGSKKWEKTATLDSAEDSVEAPIKMEYPDGLTPVHYIRLKLTRGAEIVSDNFYMRGLEENNFKAIRQLPKVKLAASTRVLRQGNHWVLTTDLRNDTKQPALMVRLKAVREKSGDRILPAIFSDNYVALMPGERRTIRTQLEDADTRGERPAVSVTGFNIE